MTEPRELLHAPVYPVFFASQGPSGRRTRPRPFLVLVGGRPGMLLEVIEDLAHLPDVSASDEVIPQDASGVESDPLALGRMLDVPVALFGQVGEIPADWHVGLMRDEN